ncbi:MAG: hypothetical protein ABIQ58_02240, partial [Candidatus Limnocylindrales bacterium]
MTAGPIGLLPRLTKGSARASAGAGVGAAEPGVGHSRTRRIVQLVLFVVGILLVWELVKLLGGVPWRPIGAGPGAEALWDPPFRWAFANDLVLPHWWTILWSLGQPVQRGSEETLVQFLIGA